ncbi:kinetochore complex Sim4 subunit Fta1-domain-containing protein [Phaeosphaeriaceae sp. PMI808]|nr:kinetochore complex Sim4 subunit Fta1-domain-containing protein [Phaeosphaeriaceae sp. PMI808]
MAGPVRQILLTYLRTTFDAHIAPLRLPSAFITSSLETYFSRLSAATSTQSIQDLIRQLHVQLSFPTTTTLLKHIEITIAAPHVSGFVGCGKLSKNGSQKPFTTALSHYLKAHLALDMTHTKAHISRISCNSFHLGTERLKLAAPDPIPDTSFSDEGGVSQDISAGQLAVQDFYTSLVREAAGSGKFLPADLAEARRASTPSSTASAGAGRRKRAISNAAVSNANTKKSKARGKENGKKVNDDDDMSDA